MDPDESQAVRPLPRELEAIFDDLRILAKRDGALHDISSIFYRDWVVTIDVREGKIADHAEKRWSTKKLNNNELMLLLGLIVQSSTDHAYSVISPDDEFVVNADRLLRELHDRLGADAFLPMEGLPIEQRLGPSAREAIYYGADSFYLHQLERFGRDRYRADYEWLIRNVGISARPMVKIARSILDQVSKQMTAVGQLAKEGKQFDKGDLTNSLLVSKQALIDEFGSKADAFIRKFSTPVMNSNEAFNAPFVINRVNLAPLIDIGDYLYAANSYRLFESIYESPFYWMMADENYCDVIAKHRGEFLERTATSLLQSVFGKSNVYENVTVHKSKSETAGEADVLVVYGEFVLVVQAKSKRVTLKAQAGDEKALTTDFEGAIQSPYRQAYEFAEFVLAGEKCTTREGKTLSFSPTVRVFPVVVLSDAFPSATYLSSMLLQRSEAIAPVIWDLGVLDCVTRMLPHPVDFLYYLKRRSDVFDEIHSDSEYNFLGNYINYKLAMPSEVDYVMLERDFAGVVDDFMVPQDMGVPVTRPVSVLERIEIPVIRTLFDCLKKAPPSAASIVIDLYDYSYDALKSLSDSIQSIRDEVRAGKAFKSISIQTAAGGFTYLVSRNASKEVKAAAEAIGRKHKYDSKRDRWYVVVDAIVSEEPIVGILSLTEKWREDPDLESDSRRVGELYNSTFKSYVSRKPSPETHSE